MKTPAGTECPYFYADYYRGRDEEECQLIGSVPPPHQWTRDLCAHCPVPRVVLANGCPHLRLHLEVHGGPLGLRRRAQLSAFCERANAKVDVPEIGCGLCHPDLGIYDPPEES
jgi:hypothetical protein